MDAVTREIAGCEATTLRFAAYPKGAELFARLLVAARPLVSAASPLLAGALAGVGAAQMKQIAAGQLSPLAALSPALLADAAPVLDALPAVLAAIIADAGLVTDLLSQTTVIANGANHKLTSRTSIGTAVGYNYALLAGLVRFAVEVNFAGPLAGALAGLSPGNPADRAAAPAA